MSNVPFIRFAALILALVLSPAGPATLVAQEVCLPVGERSGELGCWIVATALLDDLPTGDVYWHLDTYPTLDAARRAKGSGSVVVESFGRVWLFTIAGRGWRASGGEHVAEIGPLPLPAADGFAVQYMEAVFTPGMTSRVHSHPGPEAWYTLSGEICLETPDGAQTGRAGEPVIVPPGPPMQLTAVGEETRRSLVLILHDASQPAGRLVTDWTPGGLCER